MNILHISPYYPSINAPHAGGVCMGREIEELSKKHNVYVLCFGATTQDDNKLCKGLNAVKVECKKLSKIERLINVALHPFTACMFATRKSKQFERKIEQYINEYHVDAVHLEYAAMGQYIKTIKKINPQIQCNLVLHDVTYQSFIRQERVERNPLKKTFLAWQKRLVLKDEKSYLNSADSVLTFSPKDVDLIRDYYAIEAIWINTFFDVEDALLKADSNIGKKKEKTICFYGQMARSENHIAAMKLADIVYDIKGIKTYVVGNKPTEELKARANDSFIVTGFVEEPDDILASCMLAVFPLTVGAGIKIKVLHCMALGLPVITTSIGAEGIDDEGNIIDIVESDDDFRKHIQQRLSDSAWINETRQKGIEHIRKYFLWDRTVRVFKELYEAEGINNI